MGSEYTRGIGQRLRQERLRLNWSQERLAEAIGASAMSIRRWEHGTVIPHLYYREQLCQVFQVSAETLFGRDEQVEGKSVLLSAYWSVPLPRNPFFTGRETLLQNLHEKLRYNQLLALTQSWAISGLGGIGKTQTALEYAYRFRSEYTAVLWARAETKEVLETDIAAFARLLDLPEKEEKDHRRLIEAVKRWLNKTSGWLLILDNVEDITLLKPFLPTDCAGHILATTQVQSTGMFALRIDLGTMDQEEGSLLVLRRAKLLEPAQRLNEISSNLLDTARELVVLLDGFPLALDQAGAYLEETGCSISRYLMCYREQRAELLSRRGRGSLDHPLSVAETLFLSFERVEQTHPAAADFLRLCAFLHPDTISEEMILEGAACLGPVLEPAVLDMVQFDTIIAELRTYSLLNRNPDTRMLSVHRLVQAAIKDHLDLASQHLWVERAIHLLHRVFPEGNAVEEYPRCQTYLSHALVCTSLINEWQITGLEAGQLCYRTGFYLRRRGDFAQAEALLEQAFHLQRQFLGKDHPDVLGIMNDLALIYSDTERFTQAEVLLQEVIAVRERSLGGCNGELAESLNNLGYLYDQQGSYEQAEPYHRRALSIHEQVAGLEHPDTAISLISLAYVYNAREQYEQAEPLLQRALSIQKRTIGTHHPDYAHTLNNLGYLYLKQYRYEAAEEILQQALTLREKALGPEHPELAYTLTNLGQLYQLHEKHEMAIAYHLRALAIRKKRLGEEHALVAKNLVYLGQLYYKQGKNELAETTLRNALAICEKTVGMSHPDAIQGSACLRNILA